MFEFAASKRRFFVNVISAFIGPHRCFVSTFDGSDTVMSTSLQNAWLTDIIRIWMSVSDGLSEYLSRKNTWEAIKAPNAMKGGSLTLRDIKNMVLRGGKSPFMQLEFNKMCRKYNMDPDVRIPYNELTFFDEIF